MDEAKIVNSLLIPILAILVAMVFWTFIYLNDASIKIERPPSVAAFHA
jgi:hypothetical protein